MYQMILDAAQAAPTAHNNQPQRIYCLTSPEALQTLDKCTECHFGAPLAFIVCAEKSEAWVRPYDGKDSVDVDASIVTTHMMLAAADAGLGTCWVMFFIPEAVKTEFALPETLEPVAVLMAGYPAEGAHPSRLHASRKPLEETVIRL